MPLYVYSCSKHGEFEILKFKPEPEDSTNCTTQNCPRAAILVPSLPVMRPDTHWSGVEIDGKYSISKSKHDRAKKEKGIIEVDKQDAEAIRKQAKQVKVDRLKKNRTNLRKFLANELAGVDI